MRILSFTVNQNEHTPVKQLQRKDERKIIPHKALHNYELMSIELGVNYLKRYYISEEDFP